MLNMATVVLLLQPDFADYLVKQKRFVQESYNISSKLVNYAEKKEKIERT